MSKKIENLDLKSIVLPGVDEKRPLVIAGPCSAETEEQVMTTAKALAAVGVKIFRAGIWKPRTRPGGFEGVGAPGLKWLKRVKEETGMYVATEVATRDHVFEALKAGVDVLWIGARTAVNPFAMQDVADALGRGHPRTDQEPREPRLRALDRRHPTRLRRRHSTHRRHPPRIQLVRQEALPQLAPLAHPHRASPTHPEPAHHLRPEPHRR